jgi:hypothetical protein
MSQLLHAELARQFLESGACESDVFVRNDDFATLDDRPRALPEGYVVQISISVVEDPGGSTIFIPTRRTVYLDVERANA